MNDNEILKALECCGQPVPKCNECPVSEYNRHPCCCDAVKRKAIEVINRQKAEIESLEMDIKQLKSDNIMAEQNFENIKELYEAEKEKVEKAKQKLVEHFKTQKMSLEGSEK